MIVSMDVARCVWYGRLLAAPCASAAAVAQPMFVNWENAHVHPLEMTPDGTKVVGTIPDEDAGLSLIHAVLVDVSKQWRGIKIEPGDLETLNALRREVAPLAASAWKEKAESHQTVVYR